MPTSTAQRHASPLTASAPGRTRYRDTPVDVRVVLAALWTSLLFVFAYVDIFAFLRADVLRAALDGRVVNPDISVNQAFLTATLLYVLVPALMVVLSLLLAPRVSRATNLAVSALYALSVAVSCIGETWAYYLIGSAVEVLLLAAIARAAWAWPREAPADASP